MATTTTTTQTRAVNTRGRGGHRGRRGRGGSKPGPTRDSNQNAKPDSVHGANPDTQHDLALDSENANDTALADTASSTTADDSAVCWICAEPVKYWSVSECNHRTCHVCALRLRALYKKTECTFCKEPQPSVIFTTSADALWSSYTPDKIPYKDAKLAISFETQEMMEETLILLRFNCPDPQCSFIGNGWSDLKLHVRATHGKLMCDICIRFKKVFAHEHALYEPNVLPIHMPSMARGHRRDHHNKQQIEGGIHPYCEFCRECFFGDDELYAHMREKHEECFICKRNEIKDQYFRNYEALEEHFMNAHFPCRRAECLARKFVVFGSALDLKAHQVEEHGAEMSARDKRDARRVEAQFEFEGAGGPAGRRGRRDRGDRERDREPPPLGAAQPPGGGSRLQTAGARRREAFGGNLTVQGGGGGSAGASQQPSRHQTPSPDSGDADPRLNALIVRLVGLAPNPTTAVPAVKAAIRSYRVSESAARDLISTVWNILDRNLDGTASVVNSLVDLVDEEDKKRDLLTAWNGFKVEQRAQFPELVPTMTGSEWAGVTSGRVLNAKHSTSTRSSAQSSRQLWDRVARAAASTSVQSSTSSNPANRAAATANAFPPLQGSPGAGPSASTPFRQPQRSTPWASSSGAAATPPAPVPKGPTSVPGPGARSKKGPAVLSKSAFPELPSTNTIRVPKAAVGGNQSLRNILGGSAPIQPAWQGGEAGNGPAMPTSESPSTQVDGEAAPTGRKKGKGKQKQTLFTLGSFPA